MRNTVAFLLAGGMGSRLNILGWMRAKPAVPFGGSFRIIDFTMSNIAQSGIRHVGILTQYRPYSLMQHISRGEAWDLYGRTRAVKILPPSTGINAQDWYRGTADAVAQNMSFAKRFNAKRLMVLSGDHIYRMNYEPMIQFHKKMQADVTIAMMNVPWEETRHFGIGFIDDQKRIIDWEEKPVKARNNLASMGIYVFNIDYLERLFADCVGHDFGKHIIPHALENAQVYAYLFDGYWADVGTLHALWKGNMDILDPNSGLKLAEWQVRTNLEEEVMHSDRPPSRFGANASLQNSLISPGCHIEGNVINSILSPGVIVQKNSIVKDSVIMHDSVIGVDVEINETIMDKRVHVAQGCKIGLGDGSVPNQVYPDHVYTGLTILGKDSVIPENTHIHRNSIIAPFVNPKNFADINLTPGIYIEP
jgi:glucose-1-phosphate adenylyltransferase